MENNLHVPVTNNFINNNYNNCFNPLRLQYTFRGVSRTSDVARPKFCFTNKLRPQAQSPGFSDN